MYFYTNRSVFSMKKNNLIDKTVLCTDMRVILVRKSILIYFALVIDLDLVSFSMIIRKLY